MFHLVNLQISRVSPYFKITTYINNVKNSEKEDNLNMMVPLFKIVDTFAMLAEGGAVGKNGDRGKRK